MKDQTFRLLKVLRDVVQDFMRNYESNPSWESDINVFPRIEIYSTSGGGFIEKGTNSRPVTVVYDVVSNAKNEGQSLKISELFQTYLEDNPVTVPGFDIDLAVNTGSNSIEELANDDRTIYRQLLNFTYNLTEK